MRHLALESSGQSASVAIFEDSELVLARNLPASNGSLQSLAEQISELCDQDSDFAFISVAIGPGSFTGLRIGVVTAKMLGMAWKIPIVPVDTLECIALGSYRCLRESDRLQNGAPCAILPVLNAFRGQVFVAVWDSPSSPEALSLSCRCASQVVDAPPWLRDPVGSIGGGDWAARLDKVWLTGPGLSKYRPEATHECPVELAVAPETSWQPNATVLGGLGFLKFQEGVTQSPAELRPNYIRASAAEEMKQKQRG